MGYSPLVSCIKLSPHHSGRRNHKIDTITIHHMAGNLSVETCGQLFRTKRASANYGVGSDGRIALYVDEDNRSWASYSADNDNRAVTIEVANSAGGPDWPISQAAMDALVQLLADICRRNGIPRLLWRGDKSLVGQVDKQNMTVHQWFMATACPGPYLMGRMGEIAERVNEQLETKKEEIELTEAEVRKIVRDEVAKLTAERAALPVSGWAEEEFSAAQERGITDGTRPQSYVTRQEAAIMALRGKA